MSCRLIDGWRSGLESGESRVGDNSISRTGQSELPITNRIHLRTPSSPARTRLLGVGRLLRSHIFPHFSVPSHTARARPFLSYPR